MFVQLSTLVVAAAAFAGGEATILYHEPLRGLEETQAAAALRRDGDTRSAPAQRRLSFESFGRRFELELESNEDLLIDLPERVRAQLDGVVVYKGKIDGVAGSWVRLAKVGEDWSGLVSDGEQIFAIEPELGLGAAASSPPMMYRLEDTHSTGTCATGDEMGAARASLEDEVQALARALPAQGADSFIDVAVIGDRRFSEDQGDPLGLAIALFNAVDGIYSEQIGVALNVIDVDLLDDDGDLTSTSASVLLDQLTDLAGSTDLDNPGLVHLLVGRNLNGSTAGIAFVGVLCSERQGVALSEIRNSSFASDTILVAHEIGHNFGAPHDNESGSPCGFVPSGFVMNPSVGGGSTQFSGCSLDQIDDEVSRARCLFDLPSEPLPSCLLTADFASNSQGFSFTPDKQDPEFTMGGRVGDALVANVGGVSKEDAKKLRGRFEKECNMESFTRVEVSVDARLTQTVQYDPGEKSKLRIRIGGEKATLAKLEGVRGDSEALTTDFQTFVFQADIPAGDTSLQLDCINSKKTSKKELTTCEFDRVEISSDE